MYSRILVVDDEKDWLEQFRDIIEIAEYKVDIADSFKKARDLLGKSKYSLVLSDIRLDPSQSHVSFQKFCKLLQQDYSDLPIIATTGHQIAPEFIWELRNYGVRDFIFKDNLSVENMHEKIKNLIEAEQPPPDPDGKTQRLFMKEEHLSSAKSAYDDVNEQKQKHVTFIDTIQGNLIHNQILNEEIAVEGDKFENINQSIIATHDSIASGIIKIKETEGEEVANALQQLESAIFQVDPKSMPEKDKKKALSLLEELTKQVSSPNKTEVVLEAIGKSLWEIIKNVEPIVNATTTIWPIVQGLWS